MSVGDAVRSGEQIQTALRTFVGRWRNYSGGEREEAQSFLNELIDCYGVERRAAGMRFEYYLPATSTRASPRATGGRDRSHRTTRSWWLDSPS